MRLFKKKKEEVETEEEAEPQKRQDAGKAAKVEKLAAKVEAFSELRKVDSERLTRVSEGIGELRNLILNKEAEMKEIGVKAVKAAETIEALQPENMLSEVRKSEAKYQVLEAKIEAANALYNRVMEELKEIRKRLSVFRGAEELLKLNEETSSYLGNIKRVEANIESQANKMGNVYVQFQKQANELLKYHDATSALANEFKTVKNLVDEIRVKAQSALINPKDLDNLKAEFLKKIDEIDKKSPKEPQGISKETIQYLQDLQEQLNLLKNRTTTLYNSLKKTDESVLEVKAYVIDVVEPQVQNKKLETTHISASQETQAFESAEKEFSDMADEVKYLVKQGLIEKALATYNTLKEKYFLLEEHKEFINEKRALHSKLKEAFGEVSSAIKNI